MFAFPDRLAGAVKSKKSILCVGLDPQLKYIPDYLKQEIARRYGHSFEGIGRLIVAYMTAIIDAVEPFAVIVKPQMAFYEQYGHWGVWAFEQVVKHARKRGLLVLEDAKRGDGGDTANAYADGHLGEVQFWGGTTKRSPIRCDAMTVMPQIGSACVVPFLERAVQPYNAGMFLVTKTSFTPNSEVEQIPTKYGTPTWQEMASLAGKWGAGTEGMYGYTSVGVVMGATYPDDALEMRKILHNAWFLVPGYSKQGGDADGAVAGCNYDEVGGCIVNSSRGIDYAYLEKQFNMPPEQFEMAAAHAAEFARDDLNAALKRAGKLNF